MGPLRQLSARGMRSYDEAAARIADWMRGEQKLSGREFVNGRMDVSDIPPNELRPTWHRHSPLQLMQRVERTARSAPGTFEYFDPDSILNVLGKEGFAGVMDPRHFERVAAPLWDEPDEWKMQRLREYLDSVSPNEPARIDDIPFLYMRPEYKGPRNVPGFECTGHEGRHRCRTLAGEGVDSVLVHLQPRPGPVDFRNWDVGRDPATDGGLLRQLREGRAVITPQNYSEDLLGRALQAQREGRSTRIYPRPPLRAGEVFKDVFAAGGRV